MAVPPIPESPANHHLGRRPRKSSVTTTPRVGMQLYQSSDDSDDDVSVLTFHTTHTLGTHQNHRAAAGPSNIKSARQSLERLVLERKPSADDDLLRISEEDSHVLSCYSGSTISAVDEKDENNDENAVSCGDDDDDDETASLGSVLTNADKILSKIKSSPYYYETGKGRKKEGVPSASSILTTPQPTSYSIKSKDDARSSEKEKFVFRYKNIERGLTFTPTKTTINNSNDSKFLNSYYDDNDENIKPTNYNPQSISCSTTTTRTASISKFGRANGNNKEANSNSDERIQQLETETKRLQLLLQERQLQTSKASETVDASIKRAYKLLKSKKVDFRSGRE